MKCDLCENPATVHTTDLNGESHSERHLCHGHALEQQLGCASPPFSLTEIDTEAQERLGTVLAEGGTADDPAHWFRSTWSSVNFSVAAVDGLVKLLRDEDPCLRYYAAQWIGQIGPAAKDAVPALEEALQDENEHVRDAAGSALDKVS
jgi:hypothetical protein